MSNILEDSVVYRPFHFEWAVKDTIEHSRMHWLEEEVPLGEDISDWKMGKLTSFEKDFITQILRMFTQADVNVGAFYHNVLIPRIRNNELRMMLGSFADREGTHQRAYALLNDTLGLPEGDYAMFLNYKEMRDKHEFMLDANPDTRGGLALSIAKGVFNEGVSLFASFVMLLNFHRRGLMKGMCKIVEWSIRDETKHFESLAKLFKTYCAAYPKIVTDAFKKQIYDMARKVVELEDSFIDLVYNQGKIEGLEADDLKKYIRFITDRRLTLLGMKPNFDIDGNPLDWIDVILNNVRITNFFENKVTEYEIGSLKGEYRYSANDQYRVVTRDGCDWCVRAKELLVDIGGIFTEVDMTDNPSRQAFFDKWGLEGKDRTLPQIFLVDAQDRVMDRIGGYTDLRNLLEMSAVDTLTRKQA